MWPWSGRRRRPNIPPIRRCFDNRWRRPRTVAGPGYYFYDYYRTLYGPTYQVYPPFQPFNGILPSMTKNGQPCLPGGAAAPSGPPTFLTHPYARSAAITSCDRGPAGPSHAQTTAAFHTVRNCLVYRFAANRGAGHPPACKESAHPVRGAVYSWGRLGTCPTGLPSLVAAFQFLQVVQGLVHGADDGARHAAGVVQLAQQQQVLEVRRRLQLAAQLGAERAAAR